MKNFDDDDDSCLWSEKFRVGYWTRSIRDGNQPLARQTSSKYVCHSCPCGTQSCCSTCITGLLQAVFSNMYTDKRNRMSIITPPDISSANLGFTVICRFIYLVLLFVSYPPISLNGTWPKPATCYGAQFENACPNFGVTLPLNIGDPETTFFRWLHNLTAILTAYIFRTKQDINNRASALETTRSLPHHLKMS